jgi:hypothetical protein
MNMMNILRYEAPLFGWRLAIGATGASAPIAISR